MFDEEINLDPSGPTSKATQSATGNATSTAKALLRNQKFYCSRIKAEVSPLNCKGKYHYAKAQGITASPCLECAKVLAMLRKEPQTTYPEPQPTIDPKEPTMARPAKKETPATTQHEPKLELVKNPFDGWTKYDPKHRYIEQSDDFATLTGSVMQFSSKTTQENGLREYKSVDLHYRDGRIGCVFHRDERGVLKVRPDGNGRVVFSAQGFARAHKIPKELFSRRAAVVVHGHGMIEVNLKSEVAA